MRKMQLRHLAMLLLAAALWIPTGAAAESGEAVVLEKNLASKTLRLDGGVTLVVTDSTEIVDRGGNTVAFESIPATRRVSGGLMESSGNELVRWTATRSGDRIVADRIELLGVSIQ